MTSITTRKLRLSALASIPALLLSGCGFGTRNITSTPSAVRGTVFGGQQPVTGSTITVWQAGETGYGSDPTQLAQTTTDGTGSFSIPAGSYTCTDASAPVYITASGGYANPAYANPNILLAAGLGACGTAPQAIVNINEVTTAATAYALSHFFTTVFGSSSTNGFGATPGDMASLELSNANTISMLVDIPSGVARASSNGITREDTRLNTIANILAACVNDSSSFSNCATLYSDVPPPAGSTNTPTNTLQAAVSLALNPTQNIGSLYSLQAATAPFVGLPTQPDDLGLVVAYSSTDFGLAINNALPGGGFSNIDIDPNGRVFFPSDATGKTGMGYFDPSTGSFSSLLASGLLVTPQYLAITPDGFVAESDLGSNVVAALSNDLTTTQTETVDTAGATTSAAYLVEGEELLLGEHTASGANTVTYGGGSIGAFSAPITSINIGLASQTIFAMTGGLSSPCSLEALTDVDDVYTTQTLSATSSNCQSGGLYAASNGNNAVAVGAASTADQLCTNLNGCLPIPFLVQPEGIALDGGLTTWTADAGNNAIVGVNTEVSVFQHPATLPRPYGLAIDGSGNVWVSNAGCVATTTDSCTPGTFVLSELVGAAAPTIAPLGNQVGDVYAGTKPQARTTVTQSLSLHQLLSHSIKK
ncbi:MAG: hypothetical protein PW792_09445 [Acidobacteriaceae bacterium]|nr:hypothetical protein [Acidobacteriaceae bacterium]